MVFNGGSSPFSVDVSCHVVKTWPTIYRYYFGCFIGVFNRLSIEQTILNVYLYKLDYHSQKTFNGAFYRTQSIRWSRHHANRLFDRFEVPEGRCLQAACRAQRPSDRRN